MPSVTIGLRNWSDRQDIEFLQSKRLELGSRAFARGFQQNALSDAEKLFPHFGQCLLPGVDIWDVIARDWSVVAGLDLAGRTRRGTCLLILAVSPDEQRIRVPVSVTFGAWNSREIAFHVVEAIRTWNVRHTKVEDNSLQDSFIELIRLTDPSVDLAGFTTSWNKRDPEVGLPSLDREFERRMWLVPHPHVEQEECRCDRCLWIRQMLNYPAVESADGVMAAWFAREAALELGPGLGYASAELGEVAVDSRRDWGISRTPDLWEGSRRWSWRLGSWHNR